VTDPVKIGEGIKIGQIIRETGVTRATIHHYVREGLLPEPTKLSRNQALYPANCIDRVLLIKGLQKHQRMSLSEVKKVLQGAPDEQGIQRLQTAVDFAADQARVSLLNPDRARQAITHAQLMERTGFDIQQADKLEELGLFSSRKGDGEPVYDPVNVEVADALAALMRVGFNESTGFRAEDTVLYLDSLRTLLHDEIMLFLKRAKQPGSDPKDMVQLAEQGIERVTPLMLALRRKLLRDFLDSAPFPTS
jgi:DNA-binding transcriptional MerR regulator